VVGERIAGGNATVGTISDKAYTPRPLCCPIRLPFTLRLRSKTVQTSSGEASVVLENPVPMLQSVQPDR